jgi:3-hydroxyacyl-[acyl-carrier-protein] dehydratase
LRFVLLDRLLSLEPGKSISMAKNVTMAEEYLADHFPRFPVLPGVLMLEAAVETAAWLVRDTEQFAHSVVVLKSVRQARYGTFVAPGNTLVMQADLTELQGHASSWKVRGTVNGNTALQARISLAHLNLADTDPALAPMDRTIVSALRAQWHQWKSGGAAATPALGAAN